MKNRLISSTIIVATFVIFYLLGGNFFVALVSFIGIFAYKEIIFLKKYPNLVIIFGLISMLSIIVLNSVGYGYLLGAKYNSLLIPIILLTIPSLLPKYQKSYTLSSAFNLIGLIIFIGLSLASLNVLMLTNKLVILYLVIITTSNDSFAYIIGKSVGKTKFSKISPNKTLEGSLAGNLVGIILGTIFYIVFLKGSLSILSIIVITIILNIACQIGDLIFSKIKRENEIKDFSKLIPGHGGILDRLDSLLFTSLVYLLIITIL
ncbi:MAG: phosphatidate cytidylyltransferase [Bacilli bacterium]|nr:phosphatidate cytidylyltransferase [Bacilli bacterium]